ncbi:MAG: valine--tRNA ligase [Candidatus Melainabacteria bacterium]|nr:valine--tRNA ligase [Candidatus Melainabacteria bacterium]
MTELSKTYNPKEVEEKWLRTWLDKKLFKSKINPDKKNFSIALPPPNVTGSLHMGHAFGDTIQDVLIRYERMKGKNVLWQGGTDHAGIGTEVVVEKELSKIEKKRKKDFTREEFLKRVWQWKEKHGNEIINQTKKLGCAMDYSRLVFTMDENYTKAIKKVFVELYKKNLIYRGRRIVNWCPKCLTSLSDLEVETENIKGKLYHILYPFDISDISKGGITVATTRPETMFGDIAVAVNPNDGRYKKLINKKVFLPFINKEIPIIGDEAIETDFGTGCLKVTPAHDSVDYEIFERNKEIIQKLGTHFSPYPEIMSPGGKIIDEKNIGIPADIKGQDRFKARELTVQKLEELGLLKQVTEYDQSLAKHDRCGTVIEPYLSWQWYVKMKPLSEPAIKAVESGAVQPRIQFVPERYKEHYLNWLKNIKDWCISRQIWWGHQIPVWYCKEENHITVNENTVQECTVCKSKNIFQDPDVLDTWFSSALWPFVTLGWPEKNDYLKAFYPTSVLATAREIINLWVSRMVFMGLEFAGDIPFKKVLIHPVIQTPDGKRMSKSKGNAIDPLEMIEKYGADANRFWYFSLGVAGNQDVRFPGRKDKDGKWESDVLEQNKRFANKLWNAVRFVMQNLEPNEKYEANLTYEELFKKINKAKLTIADRWILFEYWNLVSSISDLFDMYQFSEISREIDKFVWDKFCDWYLEISKQQINNPDLKKQTQIILFYIAEGIIRVLHPVMPFITEEIWQLLPMSNKEHDFILDATYPNIDRKLFSDFMNDSYYFSYIIDVTRTVRDRRQVAGIPWTSEIDVRLFTKNENEKNILKSSKEYIEYLSKSKISLLSEFKPVKPSTGALVSETRVLIPLSGLVDLDNMLNSFNKKKNQFEKEMESQKTKLNNTNFINNAAPDKIDEVKARVSELESQIKTINEQIELLK